MSGATWIGAARHGTGYRLWALDGDGAVRTEGDCATLDPATLDGFAGAAVPVVVAGAADVARPLPCTPLPDTIALDDLGGIARLAAIPPLTQATPTARTRTEETAIAGFLALNPRFDGVLCLPGPDQTLWALVSAAEVVSLQPFASPRLAAALGADGPQEAFAQAVSDTLSKPQRLAAQLADPDHGCIWGHLIGAELAAARAYWLGQQVAVIGTGQTAHNYVAALTAQGVAPVQADVTAMLLKGLAEAKRRAGL
ncbi:MAG: 2-dehydro-3-deoxygalactonokinase [Rhodobacteraceae bacterium]|nr:2-dehydro-3-deoxygalactonokinase [Paracoccaceae bacterium]